MTRRFAGRPHHVPHGRRLHPPDHVEKLADTGLHLGAGLYFGLDGKYHGSYRGVLEVEGEHVAD